ncbi:MAG: hypothetical protein V1678_00230 [Candidatus Aenigmatarchaeota archaeon]
MKRIISNYTQKNETLTDFFEKFNRLAVGRELKMIELKRNIKSLEARK